MACNLRRTAAGLALCAALSGFSTAASASGDGHSPFPSTYRSTQPVGRSSAGEAAGVKLLIMLAAVLAVAAPEVLAVAVVVGIAVGAKNRADTDTQKKGEGAGS